MKNTNNSKRLKVTLLEALNFYIRQGLITKKKATKYLKSLIQNDRNTTKKRNEK